jgi:transketolase
MPSHLELANVIRVLAMDAVQNANSGHPGAPMGMADIAEVLWRDVLKHSPADPGWPDRDRFVLSNGHASMLLYAVLNLTGYPLTVDDLRSFRQLGAHTAGHPEHDLARGIETTTGPLGQGFANAVGMALAERLLAARFNRPGFDVVDHRTWVFVGDGCLMEGISHEAASLAGTLRLSRLVAVYDDNGISIDGDVRGWFADDTPARFEAYGWKVIRAVDGHDAAKIAAAFAEARTADRPVLLCCRTVIGKGAPTKAGTKATHGEALGAAEVAAARAAMGWTAPPFEVPEPLRQAWDCRAAGRERVTAWQSLLARYRTAHPELAAEFERGQAGHLPASWPATAAAALAAAAEVTAAQATRQSSQLVLNVLGPALPALVGGSADLTGSNNTWHKASVAVTPGQFAGNYVNYGVREFAMTAMMNGMALHGGVRPYAGTFLTFSDYARNAVRMAALMRQPVTLVYTHDSIGLGEDGPTHQPIEHLASLRVMPGLSLWRPCAAAAGGRGAARGRYPSWRLHADRRRRRARGAGHRHRLRGGHRRRGRAGAERGRTARATRLHAERRRVRRPGRRLARRRAAACRHPPRRHRGRCDRPVVEARGYAGTRARHRHLRRLRQGDRSLPALRPHRRAPLRHDL